jgi:hypothetical protein
MKVVVGLFEVELDIHHKISTPRIPALAASTELLGTFKSRSTDFSRIIPAVDTTRYSVYEYG